MITIPKDLIKNNLLKTSDNLSYARYVNYVPMLKQQVTIEGNVLVYVTKGMKKLHFSKSEYILKPSDLLFIKNDSYIMSEVLDEYYEAFVFIYSDKLLADFITKHDLEFSEIQNCDENFFALSSNDFLQKAIFSIVPYFENDIKESKLIELKFEEIFLNVLHTNKGFKSFLKMIYDLNDIDFKNTVEKNFFEYESINELAKSFNMSELNFRNKFKECFNSTPKKWILNQKMQKAKMLLVKTDKNVSEVCREVGFDNISWFIQSFKKRYGYTPKQQKTTKI